MYKPFEQELHDQFDEPAKRKVAEFLERHCNVTVYPNPDKYGVDLLLCRDDICIGSAEVEVRQWSPCPYSTIHIPQRKEKYFGERTLFFALTKDLMYAYWIQTKFVKQYPLKEISNYKIPRGEMFFDVPIEQFNFEELENGT